MLGELLNSLRTSRGMTMTAVIDALDVPRSTAYGWEGAHSRPDPENLQRLLDLFDASPEQRLRAWALRAGAGEAASASPSPVS